MEELRVITTWGVALNILVTGGAGYVGSNLQGTGGRWFSAGCVRQHGFRPRMGREMGNLAPNAARSGVEILAKLRRRACGQRSQKCHWRPIFVYVASKSQKLRETTIGNPLERGSRFGSTVARRLKSRGIQE